MVISSSSNAGGGEAFSTVVFSAALDLTVANATPVTRLPRTKFLRFIRNLKLKIANRPQF
jgi:hypothetical protein